MDFEPAEDGGKSEIEVRPGTDSWGPFSFNFEGKFASGQYLSEVEVTAYRGKVTEKSVLAEQKEIGDLIEPSVGAVISPQNHVQLHFQSPQDLRALKATLVFNVTLNSGGKYRFFYYPVKIT